MEISVLQKSEIYKKKLRNFGINLWVFQERKFEFQKFKISRKKI